MIEHRAMIRYTEPDGRDEPHDCEKFSPLGRTAVWLLAIAGVGVWVVAGLLILI